ncbi:aminotransferase class III-fold pyridoxal phosphate-dependent enzyme [Streptomyces sp. SS8]
MSSSSLRRAGTVLDVSIRKLPNVLDPSDGTATQGSLFASRAKGAYVWDVEGRRYLDMVLGFGSVVLGHAHDAVDENVIRHLRAGVAPTLRSPLQIELAQLIRRHVPNAELSLFLRTGSDATEAAVRVARAHTGRDRVIRWGYQGWHDWCAPRVQGVPSAYHSLTTTFGYNDLGSLEQLFAAHADEIACLIMMPFEIEQPQAGFLDRCRELAHRHGALFVLDEVRTAFRLAPGGAQEYFGIDADLVAMSKAMGNGYAISALTGPERIMAGAEHISASSVFFRSVDGFAAATATIGEVVGRQVPKRLWELGRQLCDGLRAEIARTGVPARVVGMPLLPFHAFDLPPELEGAAHQVFCRAAARSGVLFHAAHHWFVCAAMTPDDVAHACRAAGDGYRAVRAMLAG